MKKVIIAITVFLGFYIFNMFVLYPIGLMMIPGGDDFQNSYHALSYSGIAGLASIIVTCTYIIIDKINQLLKELRK